MKNMVVTTKLSKHFQLKKARVEAVRSINLCVPQAEIFGFLGPNGAGKTTTLRLLTTLLPVDSGEVFVAGYDVQRQPGEVRKRIGYIGQLGGADLLATGRENLLLQGQLYGMNYNRAAQRCCELIKAFDLADFADRKVSTYSGGQRRRLEIALGIMHRPDVLFLDEPTTGLDPQNRANLWAQIRRLRDDGTTVFLTTHYLEEADMLADRIAIMDHGQIVAEGSPKALKQQIAGDIITVGLKPGIGLTLKSKLTALFHQQPFVREITLLADHASLYVENGEANLPAVLRLLDQEKIELSHIALSAPSLDDVFLQQTGRSLRDGSFGGGPR
jgi:ABC-2 type transport system ATP-binding protein